jgi:hypothetical protein
MNHSHPSCPVSLHGERQYYLQAIAHATKRIKSAYRAIAKEELTKNPAIALNPRWRHTSQCKPRDILRNIDRGAFAIKTKPGTPGDRKTAWINFILRVDAIEYTRL